MSAANDSAKALRPWRPILFFGLVFGALVLLGLLQNGLSELARRIEILVDADGPEVTFAVACAQGQQAIEPVPLVRLWETGPFAGVGSEHAPCAGIVLIAPPASFEHLTRVTVRMLKYSVVFDRARFEKEWTRWDGPLPDDMAPGHEARVYQEPLSQDGSFLTPYDRAVNYEGDAALARHVLFHPIFVLYLFALGGLLLLRAFVAGRPVGEVALMPVGTGQAEVVRAFGWGWMLAGVAVLVVAGVLLEMQCPYYFTQDDNLAQFLPDILYGCETLSRGVFPSWNPHQYLGAPLAEVGTYALTYPLTYLSYFLAIHALGDRHATVDVFCCLHLLLGYLALFWLGRRLGMAAPLAAAFGLCQVLSGFALVVGRSWYYMTPVYVWVPLLLVALLHLRTHAPTLRWTIATGLVIGLFFHAGNAQMWVYGVGLAGLLALGCCWNSSMPLQRLVQMLPAGLVGLGVAAVLLVPQFQATRGLHRDGGGGWDISDAALAVFAPSATPVVVDPASQQKLPDADRFGTMYHAGSVFTIAWLVALLLIVARQGSARRLLHDPWMGLAIVTFLLALGKFGALWTVQARLPVLNQFNHPHKFLPFFHLFSGAVGAVFLSRAIRLSSRPRIWSGVTFGVIAAMLLHHAFWSRSALYLYAEHPYPDLPGELADLKSNGAPHHPPRILSLAFLRSGTPDYIVGLQHHFPTVYGISSIGGYDPLVEKEAHYDRIVEELKTDPRAAIRRHGVTHLVLPNEVAAALQERDWGEDQWLRLPFSHYGLVADCDAAPPVLQLKNHRVYAVRDPAPLACPVGQRNQALPVYLVPAGVDVDVSILATNQEVVVNYLWRPGTRVYADGVLLPSHADADQHIRVPVQAGTQRLELRYESPWRAGLLLGGALFVAGLAGWFMLSTWSSRFESRQWSP